MGANKRTERPGVEKREVSVADIVVSCLPKIERVATRLTRDPTEAADLVQETCRRAIEKSSYFRHRSNPAGWLCRILQHICYDCQRRRRRELPMPDLALPASEQEPISSWRWISDEDYAEAFARLSPAHQLTYRRHVTDGDSYKDIASDLNISPDTVGVRIMRARANMRLTPIPPPWRNGWAHSAFTKAAYDLRALRGVVSIPPNGTPDARVDAAGRSVVDGSRSDPRDRDQ